MTFIPSYRPSCATLFPVGIVIVLASLTFPQTDRDGRARFPATGRSQENRGFIVAFELSPEKGFQFTWPYESMKPSPYGIVLMKVKKMPRAMDGRNRLSKPLLASKYLKVNGALQRPLRLKTTEQEELFEVKLQQGRLRFSLLLPTGATLDPQFKVARIELYESNKVRQP